MLRPLPYPHPEQLVVLDETEPTGGRNGAISTLSFLDWRAQNRSFTTIAANVGVRMTLSGGLEPVLLQGARGSAAYFDVYGLQPALGRTFAPDEEERGREHVVVLSHRLWTTQFGADAGLIGRSIVLDGEPYTVIGVMPPGSVFDRGWSQFWMPLAFKSTERTRNVRWLQATARLKPGVTLERARADMTAIGAGIAADYPESNKGWGVEVDRLADVIVGSQLERSLYVLLGAVGVLLLIGCVNVANLMLVRGTAREREVAIRTALGAPRGRLVRQLTTESVLLALLGASAGVCVAYGGIIGLQQLIPPYTLPRDVHVQMNARVLVFTLLLSVATTLVFGLAPALHITAPDLTSGIKERARGSVGGRGRRRARNALIIAKTALAFTLLRMQRAAAAEFRRVDEHAAGVRSGSRPDDAATIHSSFSGVRGIRLGCVRDPRASRRPS